MSNIKHFASKLSTKFYLLIILGLASVPVIIYLINLKDGSSSNTYDDYIVRVERPRQFTPLLRTQSLKDIKSDIVVARNKFDVSGKDLTVAVLDTGLQVDHIDFKNRVKTQYNSTTDNNKDINNASDGDGHGTHVTGIIAAAKNQNGGYEGIAPKANIIPIKVLYTEKNNKDTEDERIKKSYQSLKRALEWIIKNHEKYNITAVCMSFGAGNYLDEIHASLPYKSTVIEYIKTLKKNKVAVIAAAGNDFDKNEPERQGMAYPAIIHDIVGVGSVNDTDKNKVVGIAPTSQRLHYTRNKKAPTDIFAPGVDIESSTIIDSEKYSKLSGTSQAAPYVTGVVLLLQEYHLRKTSKRPSIDNLKTYLRTGGFVTPDKDTGLNFMRLNVLGAFEEMQKDIEP